MNAAKIELTSLANQTDETPFGTDKDGLVRDHRNLSTGEPKSGCYGDCAVTVLVGMHADCASPLNLNKVLSYEFFCTCIPGGEWRGLVQPANGRRLRLAQFLRHIISEGITLGRLTLWPTRVHLVMHFSFDNLNVFADIRLFQRKMDSIRGTFVTLGQPLRLKIWDKHRHAHSIEVVIRDTMLLAPGKKQALADIQAMIALEKPHLALDEKQHTDAQLQTELEHFTSHALRGSEICVRYAHRIMELNRELLGEFSLPVTLSSIGVTLLLQSWEQSGIDHHAILGSEIVTEIHWSKKVQRKITQKKVVPTADRHSYESLATECYHGGRNEQFFFGAGEVGVWTDWDLVGAYTTGMAEIGKPRWAGIRHLNVVDHRRDEVNTVLPDEIGYGRCLVPVSDGDIVRAGKVRLDNLSHHVTEKLVPNTRENGENRFVC